MGTTEAMTNDVELEDGKKSTEITPVQTPALTSAPLTFLQFIKGDTEIPMDSNWGWFVVACSFLGHFLIFGFYYSFGVFYNEFLIDFNEAASMTSAIGSVLQGLMFATCVFVGPLTDKVGYRPIIGCGSIIIFLGFVGSSFALRLQLLFFFLSTCLGIGFGMCFFPCVSIVSTYFAKRRAFAVGVAVAGSGVGNAAVGPIATVLVDRLGWRWTFRFFAVVYLILFWIIATVCRRRVPFPPGYVSRPYRLLDPKLFLRDRVFQVFGCALAIASAGYFGPFTFIFNYVTKEGPLSSAAASTLYTVLGVTSTIGRLIFGRISDMGYISRINLISLSLAVISVTSIIYPFLVQFGWASFLYASIFGLFAGAFIATQPVLAAEFWGLETLGLTMGNMYSCIIVGTFIGPPICGVVYDKYGSYKYVFVGCGVCFGIAAGLLALLPILNKKKHAAATVAEGTELENKVEVQEVQV